MIEKWATQEGTDKYFKWTQIDPSKVHNFDSLHISALGAGTYLGPVDDATDKMYEETLVAAGLNGINCFDTAINYRNLRSERVLGKAIKYLALKGVNREQLFISTKGGYLPYEDTFEDYVRTHFLDTGVIELKDIVGESHCMSPSFLENQIQSSLKNLSLSCIDLYYLHNPEAQLAEVSEEEFYLRLTAAFSLFEQKVQEKKIQRYGIATWNGFRVKKGGLDFAKVLQCAVDAGGEGHHFKAIQLPLNLVMMEAVKQKIIEKALKHNIATFVSAPLMQGKVLRLSSQMFQRLPPAKSKMAQALEWVISTPNVCSAFCGMTHKAHLEENCAVLHTPMLSLEDWTQSCQTLGLPKAKKA